MPRTALPRLLVALVALALCACTDSPSPGLQPPPEEPPASAQALDFYQVYVDQNTALGWHSLVLVNVADFTERIPLGVSATNFAGTFATLYAGTRDGDVIRDLRPHSLYYTQGGAWQKVSLRHEGSQTPVRVSSDTPTGLCSGMPYILAPELGSSTGARLLYVLAGPDTFCGTSDDVSRSVSVDASPTTPPDPGVPGWPIAEFRDEQGDLTGLLVDGSSGLHLYDASLSQATMITAMRGSFFGPVLARSRAEALVALEDNSVHRVDASGGITEKLPPGADLQYSALSDGSHSYVVARPFSAGESRVLYRIAGGGEPTVTLWDTEEDVFCVGFTSESIILAVGPYGNQELRLLPKTADGTQVPQPVAELPAGLLDMIGPSSPLLFNVADVAYRLDADGVLTSYPASTWLGFQHAADMSVSGWPLHGFTDPVKAGAFRIDGFDPAHRHLNGTVRLIDLENDVARDITQVATEEYVRAFGARGSVGMGLFWDEEQFDVFSFDLDDGRLERHTDGTATDETEFSY